MGFNKKFFSTGGIVAASPSVAAFDPLQNFETVTYTGNGGTQKITGYIRKGAAFNGSSSKVILPESTTSSIDSNGAFSVSFWVFANSGSLGSTGRRMITLFDGIYIWIEIPANEHLRYRVRNSSSTIIENTGTTTITENAWHHIALTGDSTNGIIAYLDGDVEISSASWDGTFQDGSGASRYNYNVIGGQEDDLGSLIRPFKGKIDQVRIFDAALDSDEVAELADEEYGDSTVSTVDFGGYGGVALYQLDEDANDTGGTYNGTPTNVNFLGMAFQPDFVWIKNRETDYNHRLIDSVRGLSTDGLLYSNLSNAADNLPTVNDTFTSFDSNGFTLGSGIGLNQSNNDYVAWCWKAGGAAVTDTSADLDADISANTDAGFSIVDFNTDTTSNVTVPHGLNEAPELIIFKSYSNSGGWQVYAEPLGATKRIKLHQADAADTNSAPFNNTAPTSDVFTIGDVTNFWGQNYDYIAYCFHSVDGYQKVGSYSGAAARATVSGLGFKPRFVMIKNTTTANTNWYMWDNQRNTIVDKLNNYLFANEGYAESGASTYALFVGDTQNASVTDYEDGFQVAAVDNVQINKTGNTYIYLAIA